MTATKILHPRRELAHRVNGRIEVTLYWSADDNGTSIEVYQPDSDETLMFPVARERALDAFHHPFAYLATSAGDMGRPAHPDGPVIPTSSSRVAR